VSRRRLVQTLLAALALSAPFALVAHAAESLVAPFTARSVHTLLKLTAPLTAEPPPLVLDEPVESDTPDNWAEPVVLAGKGSERGTAKPFRAPTPAAIFVSKATVLKLAQSTARPQGVFVTETLQHPAGLRLSGVAALGIGVQDGDILIEALGITPRSPGQVIGAIIEARAQQARFLSGKLWRQGKTFGITVEQPYLPGDGLVGTSVPQAPRDSGG
jgi:hypothetical protein